MRQVNYEIELLKELVKRPSYDDGKFFESVMTGYLKEVFKKELPEFKCQEQVVSKNRSNLLFANSADPKLLVINHMDTVRPSNAWKWDPLVPIVKDNRIFGLGSSDTKGNIVALIGALRFFFM
jgi:acetylornithine deacetylase